jgi:TRAP-type C4-dicarboxylate transport system permease small subunit
VPGRLTVVRTAGAIERAVELLCNALMLVTGLAMLALLTLVVILRYLFESGLSFAPDLTELLFAIFVMASKRRGSAFMWRPSFS